MKILKSVGKYFDYTIYYIFSWKNLGLFYKKYFKKYWATSDGFK